jgi:hypothetical protein
MPPLGTVHGQPDRPPDILFFEPLFPLFIPDFSFREDLKYQFPALFLSL